jgi:WD40 repeat protein
MGNCIWTMAWSRDGSQLAAGERGGAAVVWNALTGNPRHTLRGNGADMRYIAFSEDGRYLSSISNERLLSVFDLISGLPVARGNAWIPNDVPVMYWSAVQGDLFGPVSVDRENSLIGMDGGVFSTFAAPDYNGSALGIAIAPNGRWLAVGDSRHARLWDLHHKPQRQVFASGVWNSFVFSQDGRWLYGAGEPGVVRWRMEDDGLVPGTMKELLPPGRHNAVVIDQPGQHLAAESGSDGTIRFFSAPDSAEPDIRDFASQSDSWIALSSDGGTLAVAGRAGVEVWRTADRVRLMKQGEPAQWASLSPDGNSLVVGRDHYEIWNVSDGTLVKTLPSRPIEPEQARAAFTADGRWLATGHPFGKIALWTVADWQRFAVLESPNSQPVGRFVFDREGLKLFNASTSGVVEVWDLKALNRELQKLGLEW